MTESGLSRADTNWRQTVARRRELLATIQNELVELEAELAEQLAAINAFEFKLRAKLQPLIVRLQQLEGEVKALSKQLRCETPVEMDEGWSVWGADDEGAAAGGYRYHEAMPQAPPPELDPDEGAKLKQLYRQLARRFHPDMAVNETDRAYRTQLMMAINAAYAAGDMAQLQSLSLEPDAASLAEYANGDEQLAEALLREIGRCQRRIEEIKQELKKLSEHGSARLMQKADREAAQGRDVLAEMESQLREEIARKMVERDVLKHELENVTVEEREIQGDALAEAVWDASLDQAYDDELAIQFSEWIRRRTDRIDSDDDILDDSD